MGRLCKVVFYHRFSATLELIMTTRLSHGTALYLTSDLRRMESRHGVAQNLFTPPSPTALPLMERAGLAAARLARELAVGNGKPILIFAGPGNNGGDALVVARYLKQWFYAVTVVFSGDAGKLPPDAAAAHARWLQEGGSTTETPPAMKGWGLVVDGLFGIGLTRPIEGRHAAWISLINNHRAAPVLCLDIPSGLDADTGVVHGCCVRATHTITFMGAKPGLLTLDGPDYCGKLFVDDLALDCTREPAPGSVLNAMPSLAPRRRNTHKGSYGSAGIIGGSTGMVGAALLSARAALKLGAGRVYVGLLARGAPLLDVLQPELMLREAGEVLKLDHLSCLAIGPGLGVSPEAAFYLQCALLSKLTLVIDADALNSIAASDKLKLLLQQAVAEKILTPHPAEAARLLGCTTQDAQRNRIQAATALAEQFNAHVVLKGAGSVCASPGKPWRINVSGNPGMAAAGMGDVLTGIIAALLAQGTDAQTAMDAAAWLHGAAADTCLDRHIGPLGLTAGETIDAARRLVNA